MQELHEVETDDRTVTQRMRGRRIDEERVFRKKPGDVSVAEARGQRVRDVRRYGKYILLELEHGVLAIHLGMTGKLAANAEEGPYTRAVLVLDRGEIVFDDVRQFG